MSEETNLPITWEPVKVKLADLKENPQNPKITTEVGKKRLHISLGKFGLAGSMPVNSDLTIIDGHSRKKELMERGIEEIWVSVPSRPLTDEEYKEMNAMFDVAKVGEPDMLMIEEILGDDVIEEWDLEKNEPAEIKEIQINPFKKTHVLLSFPPERMIDIQPLLQQLADKDFIEYEQTSN